MTVFLKKINKFTFYGSQHNCLSKRIIDNQHIICNNVNILIQWPDNKQITYLSL